MIKIKEVIVVEGQNDIHKIQSCVDADVIKTNGTHLSKKTLDQLRQLNQTRGIIVMTDDDYPGRWIRTQIQDALGDCKHAFVDKSVSRTSRKVGVEHASCEVIVAALEKVVSFEQAVVTIAMDVYQSYGLQGQSDSANKRNFILKQLGLPTMNGKRLYKTLNMMRISELELSQLMEDYH